MSAIHLSLGPDVIQNLIPHRHPFLMVDRVVYFSAEPHPVLRTVKFLSGNEIFFQGHFPKRKLMPGALTFEGMGQTTNLIAVIMTLRDIYKKKELNPDGVFDALNQMEMGYTLNPGYNPEKLKILEEIQFNEKYMKYGLVGAVSLKFREPIFAGSQIEYEVGWDGILENYAHFQVQASVNGIVKADGTMASIIKS